MVDNTRHTVAILIQKVMVDNTRHIVAILIQKPMVDLNMKHTITILR